MKAPLKIVVASLLASALFGLIAQYALASHTIGLNLSVLCLAGATALGVLKWKKIIDPDVSIWYLIVPLLLASYGFGVPDSRNLVLLNAVVGLLSVGYFALRVAARRPLGLAESILKAPMVGFGFPLAGFLLPWLTEWKFVRPTNRPTYARGIVIGCLFAVPFLAVFGATLGQADPIFANLFQFHVDLDPEVVFKRSIVFGLSAVTLSGYLIYLSKPMFERMMTVLAAQSVAKPEAPPTQFQMTAVAPQEDRSTEDHVTIFVTFFSLISLLFALFMIIQVRYLFGGDSVVLRTQGLTYAAYAKRGFLEIATVEAICLPLLVFSQYCLRNHNSRIHRVVNIQVLVVIGLLLMLMASAAFRLKLYVDAYGFTPLRFYVAAGMVWLLSLLFAYARFGTKWQLDKIGKFVYASMVGVTLGVNLARPDYWIARINLTRKEAQGLDPDMITAAGADAYSAILQFGNTPRNIKGKSRTLLDEFLDNQRRRSHDWRDMTLAQYAVSSR